MSGLVGSRDGLGPLLLARLGLDETDEARLRAGVSPLLTYPYRLWHYGDSIGFEGIGAAAELLRKPQLLAWLHGSLRAGLSVAEPRRETDDTLAGLVLCRVAAVTGDEQLLEAALAHASWLLERRRIRNVPVSLSRAPLRRPFGGATLPAADVPYLRDPGAAVVIDSLHFGPPFLAALGVLVGRPDLCDEAAAQARAYLDLLQDDDGLVWHLWLERTGRRYGHGWGRGQGWAMLGLADVLSKLGDDHPYATELRDRFVRLCESVAAAQLADGSFAMVVSERQGRPETSTAAFAAAAFARGVLRGWLSPAFAERAERAWQATWGRLDAAGLLGGVSAEVHASTSESHYRATPTGFVVPWGQGAVLVAALEIARLRGQMNTPGVALGVRNESHPP